MKYMLLMSTPRNGYKEYMSWPKAVLEANIAFMQKFTQRLKGAGELVSTEGLASPEQARRVRAGKDGRPITDGVFPESKEFLAGYWIINVRQRRARVTDRCGRVDRPGSAGEKRRRQRGRTSVDRGARDPRRPQGHGVMRSQTSARTQARANRRNPQVTHLKFTWS